MTKGEIADFSRRDYKTCISVFYVKQICKQREFTSRRQAKLSKDKLRRGCSFSHLDS